MQLGFKTIVLLYKASYKRIIASLLLAVYCLVATPAVALHSHSKKITGSISAAVVSDANDVVNHSTNTATDGVCKICAHQFQLHNDDASAPEIAVISFSVAENSFLNCFIPQLDRYSNYNKGPPALI